MHINSKSLLKAPCDLHFVCTLTLKVLVPNMTSGLMEPLRTCDGSRDYKLGFMESPHFLSDWTNFNLKIRWKRILRIFMQNLMICIRIWDFHTFGNDNVKIGPCCPITIYEKAQSHATSSQYELPHLYTLSL
jgi:hypothetical protein